MLVLIGSACRSARQRLLLLFDALQWQLACHLAVSQFYLPLMAHAPAEVTLVSCLIPWKC